MQEIDAYWLQRRISRAYGDAIDAPRAQQLAEEVSAQAARMSALCTCGVWWIAFVRGSVALLSSLCWLGS